MFLARRGLLKLLGTAPAAVPFAKSALTAALATAEPIIAAATLIGGVNAGGVSATIGPDMPGRTLLGPILFDHIRNLRQQNEAEKGARYNLREGGIEADIGALKSTSRAYKVMRQIQRDREEAALSARIEKLMWG